MIKIGIEKNRYSQIEYEKDGWADASKYIPADFDLCLLKLKSGKIIPGWSSGRQWDGLNIKEDCEIISWKITN